MTIDISYTCVLLQGSPGTVSCIQWAVKVAMVDQVSKCLLTQLVLLIAAHWGNSLGDTQEIVNLLTYNVRTTTQ